MQPEVTQMIDFQVIVATVMEQRAQKAISPGASLLRKWQLPTTKS